MKEKKKIFLIFVILCIVLAGSVFAGKRILSDSRKKQDTETKQEVKQKEKKDKAPFVEYVKAFSEDAGEESTTQIANPEYSLENLEKIENLKLERMNDSLVVSGRLDHMKDASIILVDESKKAYSFKLTGKTEESVQATEQEPSTQTSVQKENTQASVQEESTQNSAQGTEFCVKITESMISQGHVYHIYLYNDGKTYDTNRRTTFLINTRTDEKNVGAQYALYDNLQRNYQLVDDSSKSVKTELATEKSKPMLTAEIEQQISEELEKNTYTLENPLVIQNPFQTCPLTAMIIFNTEDACKIRVTVKGKTSDADISSVLDSTADHRIPVIGLYAGTKNKVLLEVLDEKDKVVNKKTVEIQTDDLPESLKNVVTVDQKAEDTAMGLMMISGLRAPYLYAFDRNGDIRWYDTEEFEYYGAFPLANGHFLVEAENVLFPNASMPNSPQFYEMDYLGRVYHVYFFPEGQHHEIKEKEPNGNLLIATNSNNGYEQDMIQEIDRETGKVVKSLDFTKLFEGLKYISNDDWAHINTVSYDKKTDTVLVSLRNVSAGIRINWSTDEIEWILSDPSIWQGTGYEDKVLKPLGNVNYQYEQHTVYEVEDIDGDASNVHVMLFDNHHAAHNEVSTFDGVKKSYVKMYTIDEKNKTVKQEHQYETELSSITSNFIFDSSTNSVFSVCAYFAKKTKEGALGAVYEFDQDSENVKGRYLIFHRFYRGYNIKIDLNQYTDEFDISDNYYRGELHAPVKVKTNKNIPSKKKLGSKVELSVIDQLLYINSGDHTITQVIFNGIKGTYVYNISDIKQMHENGHSYRYKLPIPLNGMEEDTYKIQVIYKDQLYDVEQTITLE